MNPWCLLAFLAVVLVTSLDAQVRLPYANEATRKLLLDALKDGDRVWRVRSLTAFTEAQDDRNKDEVKFLLNDKLDAIRYQAEVCMATSDIAQPPASYLPRPVVAESSASITHRDPRVRSVARVRMLLSDATYKDDFSELLNDPDYFVRREVSRQVVKTRANASLEVWRRLLASPRVEDRVEAAWAVGELGAREEESKLIGFLDSDSERLRLVAIDSLMKVGGDVTCQAIGSAVLKANGKTFQGLVRLAITQKDRAALTSFRQIAAV